MVKKGRKCPHDRFFVVFLLLLLRYIRVYDLLIDFEDVPNVLLRVLAVGHHVVGGVLGRLEHVPLLREQETVELA